MIPIQFALRRRMMMAGGGAFEFTYTGQFTDKIEGSKRVIKLTSSGTLDVSGSVVADVYLLAGGGGGVSAAAYNIATLGCGGGGGGGYQTVEMRIVTGTYEIVIGSGGAGKHSQQNFAVIASDGGDTIAFGVKSSGGKGANVNCASNHQYANGGLGGSPNGLSGNAKWGVNQTASGGSPNGGDGKTGNYASSGSANNGGDGYITITIPI